MPGLETRPTSSLVEAGSRITEGAASKTRTRSRQVMTATEIGNSGVPRLARRLTDYVTAACGMLAAV